MKYHSFLKRNDDVCQKVIKKRNICITGPTDNKWLNGKRKRLKKYKLFKEAAEVIAEKIVPSRLERLRQQKCRKFYMHYFFVLTVRKNIFCEYNLKYIRKKSNK